MKRGVQLGLGLVFLVHEPAPDGYLPADVLPLQNCHESAPRDVGDVDGAFSLVRLRGGSGAAVGTVGGDGCGQGVVDDLTPDQRE